MNRFRALFLLIVFVVGLALGVAVQLIYPSREISDPPKTLRREISTETDCFSMEGRSGRGEGLTIPMFKDGVRSSELTAETIVWNQNKPVELTKPIVYEFGPDGKTVITKMSADFGTIEFDPKTSQLSHIRVWGNAKMVRSKTEPKEENSDE